MLEGFLVLVLNYRMLMQQKWLANISRALLFSSFLSVLGLLPRKRLKNHSNSSLSSVVVEL